MIDPNSVGQDRTYKDSAKAADATHGTYNDAANQGEPEQRLPTTQMPKAPDPDPFTLGPQAPGGR
jgi:hypothetical protein